MGLLSDTVSPRCLSRSTFWRWRHNGLWHACWVPAIVNRTYEKWYLTHFDDAFSAISKTIRTGNPSLSPCLCLSVSVSLSLCLWLSVSLSNCLCPSLCLCLSILSLFPSLPLSHPLPRSRTLSLSHSLTLARSLYISISLAVSLSLNILFLSLSPSIAFSIYLSHSVRLSHPCVLTRIKTTQFLLCMTNVRTISCFNHRKPPIRITFTGHNINIKIR